MLQAPNPPSPEFAPSRRAQWVQYAIFFGTGAGCSLPGALLPSLLVAWKISDARAGLLAFFLWFGSSLGALLVRRSLQRSLLGGCMLVALGATTLAVCGSLLALPAFLLYGLGLGTSMTSISLMQQHVSDDRRNLQFTRLNLLWAIGAAVAPSLVVHALRSHRPGSVLLWVGCAFVAACVSAAATLPNRFHLHSGGGFDRAAWNALRAVPLSLVVMTALATGIEAGGGTWLATYAQRSHDTVFVIVAAPTALWAGLLSSRLLGSAESMAARMSRRPLLYGALTLAALIGMMLQQSQVVLLLSAYALGFGLGPLYPLLLARVMRVHADGTIFFLAGVCSALLPWLTGVVSTRAHSLRAGLWALTGAAGLLFVLLRRPEKVQSVAPQGQHTG